MRPNARQGEVWEGERRNFCEAAAELCSLLVPEATGHRNRPLLEWMGSTHSVNPNRTKHTNITIEPKSNIRICPLPIILGQRAK